MRQDTLDYEVLWELSSGRSVTVCCVSEGQADAVYDRWLAIARGEDGLSVRSYFRSRRVIVCRAVDGSEFELRVVVGESR